MPPKIVPNTGKQQPIVSVVIPCLEEKETSGVCVAKAIDAFLRLELPGEVVVSDNGSTDGSDAIALAEGARVVRASEKGYGNAYLTGFSEAKGDILIMGDADDTYDFTDLGAFVEPIRNGYQFVNGTRLKGQILPGAMPWLHRFLGNPLLSWLLNLFFHTGFSDVYCGMRSFTREAYELIRPKSTGMEFALEMVINTAKRGLKATEVPIVYSSRRGESKLRTLHDGWRSLRFLLLYSPAHLFLVPGTALVLFGVFLMAVLLAGTPIVLGHPLGNHTMLLGALLAILGVQVLATGVHAKTYSLSEEFDEDDPLLTRFYQHFNLERGILLGLTLALLGAAVYLYLGVTWWLSGFGPLFEERPATA